jgi:threonine/homoserine efflux transporter RhtA
MIEDQTKLNTQILAKLESIDIGFHKALEAYGTFSVSMTEIKTHLNWAVIVVLALGVPAVIALIKIAFC